jgi:hypothetical protein
MSNCVGLKPNFRNLLLLADTTTALYNGHKELRHHLTSDVKAVGLKYFFLRIQKSLEQWCVCSLSLIILSH